MDTAAEAVMRLLELPIELRLVVAQVNSRAWRLMILLDHDLYLYLQTYSVLYHTIVDRLKWSGFADQCCDAALSGNDKLLDKILIPIVFSEDPGCIDFMVEEAMRRAHLPTVARLVAKVEKFCWPDDKYWPHGILTTIVKVMSNHPSYPEFLAYGLDRFFDAPCPDTCRVLWPSWPDYDRATDETWQHLLTVYDQYHIIRTSMDHHESWVEIDPFFFPMDGSDDEAEHEQGRTSIRSLLREIHELPDMPNGQT